MLDILICVVINVVIDVSVFSSGFDFDYNWFIFNGQIILGGQINSFIVSSGGIYIFVLINIVNFCSSELMIFVVQDILVLVVEVGIIVEFNCDSFSLIFSGIGFSIGGFSYEWQGLGVFNGGGIFNFVVNLLGIYILVVINNFN